MIPTIWTRLSIYSRMLDLPFYFNEIVNVLKPIHKSIWLKIKPIEKLRTKSIIYQHVVKKKPTI